MSITTFDVWEEGLLDIDLLGKPELPNDDRPGGADRTVRKVAQ